MIGGIFVVLTVYGMGIAAVHVAWFIQHRPKDVQVSMVRPLRYLFICYNNEHIIEWHLRSLILYSLLKGEPLQILAVDRGSTDKTLDILERFANKGWIELMDEQTFQTVPELKAHSIVIALDRQSKTANRLC